MNGETIFALISTLVLLAGLPGIAVATPGEGPPDDLPAPVPDDVQERLDRLGSIVSEAPHSVLEFVQELVPEAASDGIDRAMMALGD